MNELKHIRSLIVKHGRVLPVITFLLIALSLMTVWLIWKDFTFFLCALPALQLVLWEVSDVHLLEKMDVLKESNHELQEILEVQNDDLMLYKTYLRTDKSNPIRFNRLVSDMTFAIRLKEFVKEIQTNDPVSEEEQEYLLRAADRLINWQVKTVKKNSEEYRYLKRNGLIQEPSEKTTEQTGNNLLNQKDNNKKRERKSK